MTAVAQTTPSALRRSRPDRSYWASAHKTPVRSGTAPWPASDSTGGQSVGVTGRPFLFGTLTRWEAGVSRAIDLLTAETDRDMALPELRSLDEIGPGILHHVSNSELKRTGPRHPPPHASNTGRPGAPSSM